jgi:hypothetical protein
MLACYVNVHVCWKSKRRVCRKCVGFALACVYGHVLSKKYTDGCPLQYKVFSKACSFRELGAIIFLNMPAANETKVDIQIISQLLHQRSFTSIYIAQHPCRVSPQFPFANAEPLWSPQMSWQSVYIFKDINVNGDERHWEFSEDFEINAIHWSPNSIPGRSSRTVLPIY